MNSKVILKYSKVYLIVQLLLYQYNMFISAEDNSKISEEMADENKSENLLLNLFQNQD